jgi:lipoprotein signal peptidase
VNVPTTDTVAEPSATPPLLEPVPGDRLGVPRGVTRRIWEPNGHKPSYVFLAGVSIFSLFSDIATKLWAEKHLDQYPGMLEIWKDHVALILAKNKGGAWGLLQTTNEGVRRPFFLLVSVAAIAFIVTLYRRLQPRQRALQWGLPLVLGGALGNVFDRVRYGYVIDFIDVHTMYKGVDKHWPTFNVADIAICVGVGLMAIDMFTSKKFVRVPFSPSVPPAQSGETSVVFAGVPTVPVGGALVKLVPFSGTHRDGVMEPLPTAPPDAPAPPPAEAPPQGEKQEEGKSGS